MWRVQIYHLNLTFRMVNRPLLVAVIGHYFLATVRPLLPLLQVPGVDNLLLISLKHLS